MDVSELKNMIEGLENRSDSLESWLLFWTFVVVLGLAIEVVVITKEHFRPSGHSNWKLFWELLGTVLITLGVAGELVIEVKAGHVNTELRNAYNEKIGLLEKETSTAQKETESIRRDTIVFSLKLAIAQKDVAEANALAREYEAGIAEAKVRAAEAEKGAAEAKLTAENERLERVKLEAVVAPRSLSIEQQRLIAATVRIFGGQMVTVSSYGLDGEGAVLATQILSVLKSAGINVTDDRASRISTGGFVYGVHLRGPVGDFLSILANTLSQVGKLEIYVNSPLTPQAGIAMQGGASISGNASISGGGGVVQVPVPSGGPISIFVGIKPPRFLSVN